MKRPSSYTIATTIFCLLLTAGCSKDSLFDFFIGSQPTFVSDHAFVPGINVFGAVRPDSSAEELINSLKIEKVIAAVSATEDSTTLTNFSVQIYKMNNNQISDSISYSFNYPDTVVNYKPIAFKPQAGEHLKLICKSEGLPTLTAETILPNQPVIEGSGITTANNSIQFSLIADSSAYLYDIYLIDNQNNKIAKRILPVNDTNTYVEMDGSTVDLTTATLYIFAYDKNFAEYLTAANLFIKPNTYRPAFSNVTNGYGCFGSLNQLIRKL